MDSVGPPKEKAALEASLGSTAAPVAQNGVNAVATDTGAGRIGHSALLAGTALLEQKPVVPPPLT